MIAVLDTGGVSALAPVDEQRRARLRALRQRVDDLVLPAAVLAEGILTGHPGRDHHVRRLLELVDVVDVDRALGHAAGSLRQRVRASGARRLPSGVDACVVALADACAGTDAVVVVTSDRSDLGRLLVGTDRRDRIELLGV